jgi:hypothetical protein
MLVDHDDPAAAASRTLEKWRSSPSTTISPSSGRIIPTAMRIGVD